MNYHLMVDDKFIDDYIEDAEKISCGKNQYIIEAGSGAAKYVKHSLIKFVPSLKIYLEELKRKITIADSIFIHWLHDGLNDFILSVPRQIKIGLYFWGGEIVQDPDEIYSRYNYEPVTFSFYNKYYKSKPIFYRIYKNPVNIIRNFRNKKLYRQHIRQRLQLKYSVLARTDYFLHWNKLDYDWIRQRVKDFDAKFIYHYYGIGLDSDLPAANERKKDRLVFWLGNSATLTNNHLDALKLLDHFKNENIKIICPLSYGDRPDGPYVQTVINTGNKIFGNKFFPVTEFLSRTEYYALFDEADVVIMFHNRTQGAGNSAAFFQMGKKIFMQGKSTVYQLFKEHGATVFQNADLLKMNSKELMTALSAREIANNQQAVREIFNYEKKMNALGSVLM